MSRKYLVAGNWKMNSSREEARALMAELLEAYQDPDMAAHCDLLVCPPYPYLASVIEQRADQDVMGVGGQDCSAHSKGAFTGEVSAQMLADIGCQYVIVGHSERRSYWSESSDLVREKFERVQASGMVPILCVGETQAERASGQTEARVLEQLEAVLSRVGVHAFARAVIAYEPVWAIGTGLNATPQQAQEVHSLIRRRIREESVEVADAVTVLYGGSVKADNAYGLFEQPDIDGALVGGASLKANDFLRIARACVELKAEG